MLCNNNNTLTVLVDCVQGRIINRFSKDVYTIDEELTRTVTTYLSTIIKVVSIMLYICFITPIFLLGLFPIILFYVKAQKYFIKTSRELTRLENTSRSPVYALFTETLDGITSIRAYKDEARMTCTSNRLLDNNQKAYFLNFSANCWLAIRLEMAGTLIITFAALCAVLGKGPSSQSVHAREAFAGISESVTIFHPFNFLLSFINQITPLR